MLVRDKEKTADVQVQGVVAIVSGVIMFSALLLPWLSAQYGALLGLTHAESQAAVAVPMTMIFLAVMTVFGGAIHILGYRVGMQIATLTSAIAFFISVMVIIVTLANADTHGGRTISLLIGPWIGAAGAVFGTVSSKLERR